MQTTASASQTHDGMRTTASAGHDGRSESEWSSYLYHDMKGVLAREEQRGFTVSSTQALGCEEERALNTDVCLWEHMMDSHMPQWDTDMEMVRYNQSNLSAG